MGDRSQKSCLMLTEQSAEDTGPQTNGSWGINVGEGAQKVYRDYRTD